MSDTEIDDAIAAAKERAIAQYLQIMEMFPDVNVSTSGEFQRVFNGFYRVRQRSSEWYRTYFELMEQSKLNKPTFDLILDALSEKLNKCEASFSSKLVATVDPSQPVWDSIVLENLAIIRPAYTSKTKLADSKAAYRQLQNWYQTFLGSDDGRRVIERFNLNVPQHDLITDVKKIDFVLWKLQAVPEPEN